jgi:hypothetical protein
MLLGLPGRLTKGAGTHLASWLQESPGLSSSEAQTLLDSCDSKAEDSARGQHSLSGLHHIHGKKAGHSNPITDTAYSGALIITKDKGGMRLWRAGGDYALLRCVAAKGLHVAVHSSGQYIVTGTRGREIMEGGYKPKVWGPAGGSAFSVGKKRITRGVE